MPWADHSSTWALRHRTTEPVPRRTIETRLFPSTLVISRTRTRSAMSDVARPQPRSDGRAPATLPVTALVNSQFASVHDTELATFVKRMPISSVTFPFAKWQWSVRLEAPTGTAKAQ